MIVALPQRHKLAGKPRLPLSALAGEPFVLYGNPPGDSLSGGIFVACAAAGFTPKAVQYSQSVHTTLGLVAGGLGVALVPGPVSTARRRGVVFRPLAPPVPITEVVLVYHRDENSPAAVEFLSFVRGMLARNQSRTSLTSPGLL
jgi:DNA-binding transcriptional LysR family regulator